MIDEMKHESSNHHFGLTVGLAVEALKALLLLNGGAATAFIALADKAESGPDYTPAIVRFGLGAMFTVTAMIFGYFSQLSYANHRFSIEDEEELTAKRWYCAHFWGQVITIGLAIASVVCFCLGLLLANASAEMFSSGS